MPHLSVVSIVSLISRKKSKKFYIFKRNQETHKTNKTKNQPAIKNPKSKMKQKQNQKTIPQKN